MHCFLFVCYYCFGCFPHYLEKLSENVLVCEDRLGVHENKSKNNDFLGAVGASHNSHHILLVFFCSLPHQAESQIETHQLPEISILPLHLRRHYQQNIGQIGVKLIRNVLFLVNISLWHLNYRIAEQLSWQISVGVPLVLETVNELPK